MDLCSNLIKWLQTFDICSPLVSLADLTDGVMIGQILHQICPNFFSDTWLSKIKSDSSLLDKRIKISNLKKVVRGISEYFTEVLKHELSETCLPNVTSIVEHHDTTEFGLLLKLVLCCAVKSDKRREYIGRITTMDESIQVVIMQSIQELLKMEPASKNPKSADKDVLHEQLQKTQEEVRLLKKQNETMTQNYEELEQHLNQVLEEKSKLLVDINDLNERLLLVKNLEDTSANAGRRHQQLIHQLEQLKDELYRTEIAKSDIETHCNQLKKDLGELQLKNDKLCSENREVGLLKDEVDQLKNVAEKLKKTESQVELYKKKQDKFADLKLQLTFLEETNAKYLESQQQLEQEVRRLSVCSAEMDGMRKQMLEMKTTVRDEQMRADRVEIENRGLLEKLKMLQQEREQLTAERDSLNETNEELKLMNACRAPLGGEELRGFQPATPGVQLMVLPFEIREKVFNLQQENKKLKMQIASQDRDLVLRSQLDEANAEKMEMETTVRILNYRLLELEAVSGCVGELQTKATAEETANATLRRKLAEQVQRCRRLEEELQVTKERSSELQARTRKAELEFCRSSSASNWKTLLEEKDKCIEELEKRLETMKNLNDTEEKLMMTAWYNLGQQLHTKTVLSRLSSGNVGPTKCQMLGPHGYSSAS